MNAIWLMILDLVSAVYAGRAGECDMVWFYREMGCVELPTTGKIIKTKAGKICPDAYRCPDWKKTDKRKCYYRGLAYNDLSTIPHGQLRNPCKKSCECHLGEQGEPSFTCQWADCVGPMKENSLETATCHLIYSLDQCCNVDKLCDHEKFMQLPTCLVDGRTYTQGHVFEPPETKLTCLCTADFKVGVIDYRYCTDIECGVELKYQAEIRRYCAPVFLNATRCPIDFHCEDSTSKVVNYLNNRGTRGTCTFGKFTLTVGQYIETNHSCFQCQCLIPPYITCTKASWDCGKFGATTLAPY